MEQLMESLASVMSRGMVETATKYRILQFDQHLRIFLHCLEQMDVTLNGERKKSVLQSSCSYLSSLKLKEMIKLYGSLRNVWEGGTMGEGILSEMKPLISDLQKNQHINAGTKHHRLKIRKTK
eukprot:209022-Ditylum_brightwellii.AAC.1